MTHDHHDHDGFERATELLHQVMGELYPDPAQAQAKLAELEAREVLAAPIAETLMAESARATLGGWCPSGRCFLFVCDIASFGHPSRTDHVRAHVRAVLYAGLRNSFDDGGIAFDGCYREDRGDGVMIAVPPQDDTAVLITSVIDRLHAEVRRHNDVSSTAAQMQLRVAVHTGEAHWDGKGLVSTAVTHAFRILDAGPVKKALWDSCAALALVVSERVYDDVVRHGRGLVDPGDYRQIEINVKETETAAWIKVPDIRPPGPAQVRDMVAARRPSLAPRLQGGYATPNHILFELVDCALDIPVMTVERHREQVVGALSIEIAGVIPRSADARSDIYSIIRTCLDYPGGLQELLQAIRGFVGDSMALRRLEQTITRLLLWEGV